MATVRLESWSLAPAVLGTAVAITMLGACFAAQGAISAEALERHVPDDTYYYLQIAWNVSTGHGSCFSHGEPTNGYHPLWLWVLSLVRWLLPWSRDGFAIAAVVVGALFAAASTLPLQRFLVSSGLRARDARFVAFFYVANPWLLGLSISGMETGLFLFLLMSLLARTADRGLDSRRDALVYGVLAGLLMLARTDSVFFTGGMFLYFAASRARPWPWIATAGTIAVLVVAPWLMWSQLTFGSIEQSSSDAIPALMRARLTGEPWQHVELAYRQFSRTLFSTVVYPLAHFAKYEMPGYVWSGVVLVSGLVAHVTLRWRCVGPWLPLWFWAPVAALLAYEVGFRLWIQSWHLTPLFVVLVLLAGRHFARLRSPGRVAVLSVLVVGSCWSSRNGFYAPQQDTIAYVKRFAAGTPARARIGHSDCGMFAYFGRHTVINLDGVVNNTALKYVREGRLADYLVAQAFDQVHITDGAYRTSSRNIGPERWADVPVEANIVEAIEGVVDEASRGATTTIVGWVMAPDGDALATYALVTFVDARHQPLATFRAPRVRRADLAERGVSRRYGGFRLVVAGTELPPTAVGVRLGIKSREGARWSRVVYEFAAIDAAARAVVNGLRVEPPTLRFDAPDPGINLRVYGRGADGVEREIGGEAGFRTVGPGLIEVRDGSAVPLRRGRGTLMVRHGRSEVGIPIEAAWADVLIVDERPAGGEASRPRLRLGERTVDGGGSGHDVVCDDLPSGTRPVLVTSARAVPAMLPGLSKDLPDQAGDLGSVQWEPLRPDGASTQARATVPFSKFEPGRPVFVRVLCFAADSGAVLAASNIIVLTRD